MAISAARSNVLIFIYRPYCVETEAETLADLFQSAYRPAFQKETTLPGVRAQAKAFAQAECKPECRAY